MQNCDTGKCSFGYFIILKKKFKLNSITFLRFSVPLHSLVKNIYIYATCICCAYKKYAQLA